MVLDSTAEWLSDVRKWEFLRSLPLDVSENTKEGMTIARILTHAVVNHVPGAARPTLLLFVYVSIE